MYIQGAWEGLMRASDPQELKIKVGCELAAVGAGNWTCLLQEQWALTTHQPFLQPHTQIPSADTNILSAPWGLLSCECITTLTEVLSTVALLWSPLDPEAPSSRAWWTCLCDCEDCDSSHLLIPRLNCFLQFIVSAQYQNRGEPKT